MTIVVDKNSRISYRVETFRMHMMGMKMMQVTLKDVAQLAGVAVSTASAALNNKPRVAPETKRKVREAADKLGYIPNTLARGLITQRSYTIGLVISTMTNPFFGELTHWLDEYAKQHGYNMILQLTNDRLESEAEAVRQLLQRQVDGFVIVPVYDGRAHNVHYYELVRRNKPFVFCSAYNANGLNADYVMGDLRDGSYKLTRHLLETGHREIAFVTSKPVEAVASSLRLKGYQEALAEFGVPWDPKLVVKAENPLMDAAYDAVNSFLKDNQVPEAIMAINDFSALGVLKAVSDIGLKVPDDISVAGYDDVVFSSIAEVPLTTVRQPVQGIAEHTIDILLNRIEGTGKAPCQLSLSCELIQRKSTRRK